MHIPPVFREEAPDALRAIMREARLCQFVTATAAGPIATPIPMILAPDEGELGVLYGHVARANPQWQEPVIGEALAIFMGADAYVSPGWYPSKQAHGKVVPTWNYEAVHAYGPVEFFDASDRLLNVVTRLTDRHEAHRPDRWRVSDAPKAYIRTELGGIVGLRLLITRLLGKRKLSQNRSSEDRAGVVSALAASDCDMDRRVAELMQKTD
ncbi:FMN-binding negative transcriptional regulator [Phenylobacterium sp. LjRoot225]|uniref:FMN-binding negative transcriptional regulator n=1 Tax=Phenylobacterium sp. LjRoot225 TaxID=3342285 RepID=UPI003ED0B3B8